jgi:hypothetical protein
MLFWESPAQRPRGAEEPHRKSDKGYCHSTPLVTLKTPNEVGMLLKTNGRSE